MAHRGRYEVFPEGEQWSYRYRTEQGKAEGRGENFATRSEAIAAAKAARGDKNEELFRADGSAVGNAVTRGPEAIVLLRPDGSVYGELDHEERTGGTPQRVTLTPANEKTEAVNVDG